MRLLITGASGYVGGRLAQSLAVEPDYSLLLGSRQAGDSAPWAHLGKPVQTRWDSPSKLARVCEGVDAVIHLAGMNAGDCAADPSSALRVNGLSTSHLLQAAIQQGTKRFIYLSTAHVYASPLIGTLSEQSCSHNLHPYATSHRAGEDVVRFAHARGDIEGIVVRLSNAFGVPAHRNANCWMLLVNDLCRQSIENGCMVLRSSGLQRRDFITLADTCRSICHLLGLPVAMLGDGVFNVGGQTMSVISMAEKVQERCLSVCGFLPEIKRPEPSGNEVEKSLEYISEKLRSTGFLPSENEDAEIDAILKMCQA